MSRHFTLSEKKEAQVICDLNSVPVISFNKNAGLQFQRELSEQSKLVLIQPVSDWQAIIYICSVYRNPGLTYSTAGNGYWFSVLLQIDNGGSSSYPGISLFSSATEQIFYGQRNVGTPWGLEQHAGRGASSSVSTLGGANSFLVVELIGTSGDATHRTANLYVNPTSLGVSALVIPSATITFTGFSLNRFRAQSGNEDLDVDELHFGHLLWGHDTGSRAWRSLVAHAGTARPALETALDAVLCAQ